LSTYTYPGAAYEEPDIDGDGVDDCTEDADGDGYGSMDSYYADVSGTDCDDTDASTFPGAGYMEDSPTDEECLTDADDDGYAAIIPPIASFTAAGGECYTIIMSDTYSDGCDGSLDLYMEGMFYRSYDGPAYVSTSSVDISVEYEDCTLYGVVSLGWTEASSYNSECYFSIEDSYGTTVVDEMSDPPGTVPGGGTDADDSDSTVY
jgi:hypothetical protein